MYLFKVRRSILFVWILAGLTDALPTSYVKFVRNFGVPKAGPGHPKPTGTRAPRSFFYALDGFEPFEEIWSDNFFLPSTSDDLLHFGFESRNGHITPDFSNGLGRYSF